MSANLISFSILAAILVLIPGLDFTLVLRFATTQSKRAAMTVALGICTSLFIWGALASFGISAILQTSELAFNILKYAGIAYMFYMGIGFIRASFKPAEVANVDTSDKGTLRIFYRGMLCNLLNPKAGVFYISVLPQFIPKNYNHVAMGLVLTSIHAAISIIYFALLIFFVGFMKDFLQRPTVAKYIERFSGAAVIGFGFKLMANH